MYTVDGLKHGIERCRHNIGVLADAMSRERETIKEYKRMIKAITREEKQKVLAQKNIHIEVVADNGDQE